MAHDIKKVVIILAIIMCILISTFTFTIMFFYVKHLSQKDELTGSGKITGTLNVGAYKAFYINVFYEAMDLKVIIENSKKVDVFLLSEFTYKIYQNDDNIDGNNLLMQPYTNWMGIGGGETKRENTSNFNCLVTAGWTTDPFPPTYTYFFVIDNTNKTITGSPAIESIKYTITYAQKLVGYHSTCGVILVVLLVIATVTIILYYKLTKKQYKKQHIVFKNLKNNK